MFLNGDDVDDVFLAASNNLLKFMPDTSISLTVCVGQGPNVVCGDIESLADVWCSLAGGRIRDMDSDCSDLTILRDGEIALGFKCSRFLAFGF